MDLLKSTALLIIDPQVDYCENNGLLFEKENETATKKINTFIKKNLDKLDLIALFTKQYPFYHINHPLWWVDENGYSPKIGCEIKHKEISGFNRKWVPRLEGTEAFSIPCVKAVEDFSGSGIIIQKPHCLAGSHGQSICSNVYEALLDFQEYTSQNFVIATRGENYKGILISESGVKSENIVNLFKDTCKCDNVIICGGSSSSISRTASSIKSLSLNRKENIYFAEDTFFESNKEIKRDLARKIHEAGTLITKIERFIL